MINGPFLWIFQILKGVRWKDVREKQYLLGENAKSTTVT